MNDVLSAESSRSLTHAALPRNVWTCLLIEGFTSLGCSQLLLGIFFFTSSTLGWEPRHNLLMAATVGVVYVFASLSAEPFSRRLGRRGALIAASTACAIIALFGMVFISSSALVATTLLLYTIASTLIWPVLESTVATGCNAHEMSRRIGIYNLVWSGVNIVGVSLIGTLITYWPAGVFIVPALAHLNAVVLIVFGGRLDDSVVTTPASHSSHSENAGDAGVAPTENSGAVHAEPEPELLRVRKLALSLSRLALPATYMVMYGMMALMPTLPVMQSLPTSMQTLVGSIWLAVRWIAFLILGATVWWHTRPIWLLWATILMLAAFLGITVRPSDVAHAFNTDAMRRPTPEAERSAAPDAPGAQFGGASQPSRASPIAPHLDLASMIFWQITLGFAVALIYAASLYFGMVLSEASTAHGGYHEALIGLGSVLGPGSGALAQWLFPGKAWVSTAAVGSVIALTALAGAIAAIRARRA